MITTLLAILVICVVFYAAYWVITTAFPEPIRMIALIVVGIIALLAIVKYLGVVNF